MIVYLDASVLVALFTQDALTDRATQFLEATRPVVTVSDFASAEFASAVARLTRMQEITQEEARAVLADFDLWRLRTTHTSVVTTADIAAAAAYLRRLDLTLRTADAINIAIAQRLEAPLATFDIKMAASARVLGSAVAEA